MPGSGDAGAPSTSWYPSTAPPPKGPPPAKGSRYTGPLLVAGAAATAAIAAAVVGFVVVHQSPPAPPPPTPSTTAAPLPTTTSEVPTTDLPAPPPSPTDPDSALQQEADTDSPTADSLVGAWIPQVSSKKVGLVADGITYDDAAIWADFQQSKNAHSDAILVRSAAYTSFRLPDYWVTVIAERFATATDANSWCSQNGYGVNDCFAKRLSHTDGPPGNTVPRG